MAFITVFTPTYNRKHLLGRLYDSLKEQDDKDFIWLIIDDGSDDGTQDFVDKLINISEFEIEYHYKTNGGLLSGYNEAFKHIHTEACFCCDSDDWLPVNCISLIKNKWKNDVAPDSGCAGIIGLDYNPDGEIIGKKIRDVDYINLNEEIVRGRMKGDKKIVVKSDIYKSLKQVEPPANEKDFNPSYYHTIISKSYQWAVLNKNLCYVEYQQDGRSRTKYKQYLRSPNSFICFRKLRCGLKEATLTYRIRQIIHYDAECIIADRLKEVFDNRSPDKLLSILFFPAGILLYFWIRIKNGTK